MSTRMTDRETRGDNVVVNRPAVWPWVVLAIVVVLIAWWAVAQSNRANAPTVINSPGVTPGLGTTPPATNMAPTPAPATGPTGTGAGGTAPGATGGGTP